jgi:aryl-alcohol dehydrogenase-like predicted oxidoreductase
MGFMRYNALGQTGLLVSELCLGTMTFGGDQGMWGHIGKLGQDEADALVKVALDAGINIIDTANVYAEGRSEEITGRALKNLGIPRDDVLVATKVFGRVGPDINAAGASRVHILAECKKSLKRLGLDHIDLYQLHGFDPVTPVEEMLEALDVLVRHGHVRYVGLSNWAAWQVVKALGIAERKSLAPPRSLQSYYTLAGRDLEREIVPMLMSEKVGLMVWSPMAGGLLSGKYDLSEDATVDTTQGQGRRATFDFPPVDRSRARSVVDVLREIAAERGCSVPQLALAWLLHQRAVTTVIIGAKRPEQLMDNIQAVEVELTRADLDKLDAVSALPREYPGWMFERQSANRPAQTPRRL